MTQHAPEHFKVDWDTFRADLLNFQRSLDLNNTDFARALGISLGTLTRYLNGERAPASEIMVYLMLLMEKSPADYVATGDRSLLQKRLADPEHYGS